MDMTGVSHLLSTIAIHYPAFRQHISDKSGKLHPAVVKEWYRLLGWMEEEDALRRFDDYLAQPEGNRFSPDIKWFIKGRRPTAAREEQSKHNYDRLDKAGRLMDAEGRLYAFPDRPDELYHYDNYGRIVDSCGRLVEGR